MSEAAYAFSLKFIAFNNVQNRNKQLTLDLDIRIGFSSVYPISLPFVLYFTTKYGNDATRLLFAALIRLNTRNKMKQNFQGVTEILKLQGIQSALK